MAVRKRYDCVVVGAGAAGMGAAAAVAGKGHRVAVIEREEQAGGILLQCIHNGFGLHHFKQELTGPEYAGRVEKAVRDLPVDILTGSTVTGITGSGIKTVTVLSATDGLVELKATTVILAMGCRERNRGAIGIPGNRVAGIFTAGLAQRLLNMEGYVPGRKVVIVGSGDIGLIMARRMTWVGAKVLAVVEILPHPSGLTRNIVQCLQDFNIPLYLNHGVTGIFGKKRVEKVAIAPLEGGIPRTDKTFTLACDTVLLSVGLVPENELSRGAGVALNPATGGPVVDHRHMTTVPGIFACGNVLHVHDLVDFVSAEAAECGASVCTYLEGRNVKGKSITIRAGANIRYVVPGSCVKNSPLRLLMRSQIVAGRAELTVTQGKRVIRETVLRNVKPAEMLALELRKQDLSKLSGIALLTVSLKDRS